jgi:hypothetical protein
MADLRPVNILLDHAALGESEFVIRGVAIVPAADRLIDI